MPRTIARLAPLYALVVLFSACDDATAPGDATQLTLSFVSASQEAAPTASSSLEPSAQPFGMVEAVGANGILTIDELQIVVDEFKLEQAEGTCQVEEGEEVPEECATFETPPYFLDLPLDAVPVDVAAAPVAEGIYTFLKLETKDLASSARDDVGEMETLGEQVLAAFPDWPESASLRLAGSFDPDDGSDPRPFVVYLHAEVKVELGFDPALAVDAEDEATGVVVEIDPVAWLTQDDGTVTDLSAYDFATTEEVVEFEAKMAEGFTKVEIDG